MSGDQFVSVKAKLPWGQLPVLKYNGTMLAQSMTIARRRLQDLKKNKRQTQYFIPIRFLATEHGLAGRTSLEAAQADEIVDAITDMVNVRVGAVFEPDEAKKAEKMQAYLSQTLPTGLVRIFFVQL